MRLNLYGQTTASHSGGVIGLAAALADLAGAWPDPPWTIEADWIELDPEAVPEIARRTFRLDPNGLVRFAGQPDLPETVRAILQTGRNGSIWQHTAARTLGDDRVSPPCPAGEGAPEGVEIVQKYRTVTRYLAQSLGEKIQGLGKKAGRPKVPISGIQLPNGRAPAARSVPDLDWGLPLYFLPVAATTLPYRVETAAHPHAVAGYWPAHCDLRRAREVVAAVLPSTPLETAISGPFDAAFRSASRLESAGIPERFIAGYCWRKTAFSGRQVAIVGSIHAEPGEIGIRRYRKVLELFPNRVGQAKTGEGFVSASKVREPILENLTAGRPWHFRLPDRVAIEDLRWERAGLNKLLLRGPG